MKLYKSNELNLKTEKEIADIVWHIVHVFNEKTIHVAILKMTRTFCILQMWRFFQLSSKPNPSRTEKLKWAHAVLSEKGNIGTQEMSWQELSIQIASSLGFQTHDNGQW